MLSAFTIEPLRRAVARKSTSRNSREGGSRPARRDTKKGIATRGPNGGYLREVDQRDREDFIDADVLAQRDAGVQVNEYERPHARRICA